MNPYQRRRAREAMIEKRKIRKATPGLLAGLGAEWICTTCESEGITWSTNDQKFIVVHGTNHPGHVCRLRRKAE